jgi:hypothetical protein
MTATTNDRVRTLVELLTDDGTLLAPGWVGTVIGFEGDKLIVSFEDHETGESRTATVNVWEVRK